MLAKAIVCKGPSEIRLETVEVPSPVDGEVLVRMEYTGVSSGTERWIITGQRPVDTLFPCILGYQSVGRVIDRGRKVSDVTIGERVLLPRSKMNLLGNLTLAWGGHISHAIAPAEDLVRCPEEVKASVAALTWMAAIALNGIKRVEASRDSVAVVMGQGLIGQLAAQLLREKQAFVIGADLDPFRCKVSARYGADQCVDTREASLKAVVLNRQRQGSDIVIEATGLTDLIDQCTEVIREEGHLVLLGWYPGNVRFHFHSAHMKGITMHFPHGFNGNQGLREALEIIKRGKVHLEELVTHEIKMEEAGAIKNYSDIIFSRLEHLGVILDWRAMAN
jgi:bacteriochlorophyllide a dehydrogenase